MANNTPKLAFIRLGSAVLLMFGALWAAGLAPVGAFGLAPAASQLGAGDPAVATQLKGLSAKAGRRITTLTIETSDPVAYLTNRPDPMTVVIDLREVEAIGATRTILEAKGLISGGSVEQVTGNDGVKVARVRIRLTQPASHQVRSKRNVIYVDLDSAFPVGSVGAASPLTAGTPGRFATLLESVSAEAKPSGASITLTGNGELIAESVTPLADGTPRVVLEFANVRSKAPAEVFVGRGPVSVVRVTTTGAVPTTRVVVDLLRPASYRVIPPEAGDREFTILFEDSEPLTAVVAGAPEPTAFVASLDPISALLARGGKTVATGSTSSTAAMSARGAGPSKGAGPFAQVPQQGAIPQLPPATAPAQQPRFTGHPITLDFQSADLRTVLRTFAEISGLNIVIDQSVQGSVDVSLNEVPWDQALDIILRDHKLGYSVDGTIVRIAPLDVLSAEEDQRRKLIDAQALSGELQVVTRPLSYARAAQLIPLLTRTALSSRGDVQMHEPTNTIIIRDLAPNLQRANQLIDTLDRPQPQVEIEARIVTTTRDYARRLGVQWGFNGRVATELGNTTGLAFPNQGSLGGRLGSQGPDGVPTGVNLAAPAASSAIGLALGSVNGAFNLDVALTALEESGNGRILSTPRVTTQNNVAAEITQGVQIPIQTVANNTITVTFQDAALKLNVTPQITAANTVIMQVTLENSSADFSRAVNGIPPINTQRALTSILVSDGQTSVIGGIYVTTRDTANDRTPGLHKIPLLGWLFKRQEFQEESRELLIFITPRIIKG